MAIPLFHNGRSFVSGAFNDPRLRICYYSCNEKNTVYAKVWFGPYAEGPPGHAHGGGIAAVLDETMGMTAWHFGHPAVAVSLNVKFLRMMPLGSDATIRSKILLFVIRFIFSPEFYLLPLCCLKIQFLLVFPDTYV